MSRTYPVFILGLNILILMKHKKVILCQLFTEDRMVVIIQGLKWRILLSPTRKKKGDRQIIDSYNPPIAAAFFRAGYIETWGRGIEKINHECDVAGVHKPDYYYEFAGLMITFQEDIKGKTRVEKAKLKTLDLILETLSTYPNMTLANVAKKLGVFEHCGKSDLQTG